MVAHDFVTDRMARIAGIAGALALAALAGAAPAVAQGLGTSRVTAVSATIYARCDPASPARAVLERGAVVTIEAVNEGWVSVRVTGGEQGCMRRSDLEPTPAIDRAADTRRAREVSRARGTPVRRTPASTPTDRVFVSVNASYLTASRTFDDSRTFTIDGDPETATFTGDYAVEPSVGVDAGAIVRLWQGLGAGVAFTSYSDRRDIEIEASLPHPLKFNSPRTITGTAAGDHEETAVHLQIAYIVPVGKRLSVIAFGGPSFFTVKQSVVTAVQHRSEYPHDEATFTGATVETEEESKTGFNVGADVAYFFTKNVGVGGIVRFSSTTTTFSLGDVDAGGALVGGGVRLRF
jgi:hypothetical protein